MKNKGFTLIELISVLAIIAIVALITIPTVSKNMKSYRQSLYNTQIKNIENAAKAWLSDNLYLSPSGSSGTCNYANIDTCTSYKTLIITLSTLQDSGFLDKDIKNPKTKEIFDENMNIKIIKNGSKIEYKVIEESYAVYSAGNEILFDPTTGKKCSDYKEENSLNENKEGCMKWYVITTDDTSSNDTIDIILDHNTTALVAYNAETKNNTMKEAATALSSDTSSWKEVTNPRLITADEVADITGASSNSTIKWSSSKTYTGTVTNIETQTSWFYLDGSGTTYSDTDGWQTQVANSSTKSKYAWLFNYTKECSSYGCNIEDSGTQGYWTDTPIFEQDPSMSFVWTIFCGCLYSDGYVGKDAQYGIRPVITISKDLLK